ncbi:protein CURLY FLAG LEAF 1-like [Mercurialis annua]|uniref:protein CURLY FLAG LEAF 1-like n=1 Tax=Mercurialis annua TaxID=3986 RepID=UPI00215FCAD5|nr:protein CURLY FLAG LEAF 1-like [Mercurialis annua]
MHMVSLQLPSTSPNTELDHSSKKRKWDHELHSTDHHKRSKPSDHYNTKDQIELHLETPLPLGWQRCLDIQSGEIHFYNTRTKKRTSMDPRTSLEPISSPAHMSLDLELNLQPCESQRKTSTNDVGHKFSGFGDLFMSTTKENKKSEAAMKRSPSWLVEGNEEEEEMVASVCTRCHMLVILCKSSPSCPNCKFMHPPDHSPKLFNQRFSLLC